MSARQDVDGLLGLHGVRWSVRQAVQILMGDFTHELAEQGRKVMGPRLIDGEPEHVARYVSGWHDAMDHIDPEVEK